MFIQRFSTLLCDFSVPNKNYVNLEAEKLISPFPKMLVPTLDTEIHNMTCG